MTYAGSVNAEGGPLLLLDAALIHAWRGAQAEDYARVCEKLDANPSLEGVEISIGDGKAILWEMKGAGTADVFQESELHLIVQRAWLHDPTDALARQQLASEPPQVTKDIGNLKIDSGVLAVLWAVEDGSFVETQPSVEGACLVVAIQKGVFRCVCDEIQTNAGVARRLHLRRSNNR